MSLLELGARAGHVTLALAAVFLIAYLARAAARLLRQPPVIAEIAVGLLVGPAILVAGGSGVLAAVLPEEVFTVLRAVGHVGLVLFLVGVAHKLRGAPAVSRGRAVVCVATGALLVPLATGVVFAAWVVHTGEPAMRGDAPTAALTLFIAVSLSVTAVPVLARILADRGLMDRELGRVAMTTAVIIDAVAWLLLALAIGLAAGAAGGVLRRLGILAFAMLGTLLVFRLLRWRPATRLCVRFPRVTAALIAVVALLAADGLRRWGLTEILGALAVGYAIPAGVQFGQWDRAVNLVARIGRWLVPVFFVSTGITVFARQLASMPWTAVLIATVLAVAGKVGGSYLGGRLAGESAWTGLRLGVLLNTRGLTELVVLQAGYSAGILTPALYLALVAMALITTAMTGLTYSLIDRQVESPKVTVAVVEEEVPA